MAVDEKYACPPDLGRVIVKGSEEFMRISAELLMRENNGLGDVMSKKSLCCVEGCTAQEQHNTDGMCKRHFSERERTVLAALTASLEAGEVEDADECDEEVTIDIIDESDWVQPALLAEEGSRSRMDIQRNPSGIDELIYFAIDEALEEKKQLMLAELSGLPPGKTICVAAGYLERISEWEHNP
jgi:hypothetical protein